MEKHELCFLLVVLAVVGNIATCLNVSNKPTNDTTEVTSRSSRTEYAVYSPPDDYVPSKKKSAPTLYTPDYSSKENGLANFQTENPSVAIGETDSQFPQPSYEHFVPVGYYKPKPRYYSANTNFDKSGTNENWHVWKDAPDMGHPKPPPMKASPPPPPDFEEYYFPPDAWKGDPWTPDKMTAMVTLMNQMSAKPKTSLLSSLLKEPLAILMAAILPISLILAAVLPTLANMMMNGGLPTITTTATGNKARRLEDEVFLSPVIKVISTFGARAFDNPGCMQRIFCQVTKGGDGTNARAFQKAMHKVSTLVSEEHLNRFGVKALFDSMSDGNCEKIPCSNPDFNEQPKDPSKWEKSQMN